VVPQREAGSLPVGAFYNPYERVDDRGVELRAGRGAHVIESNRYSFGQSMWTRGNHRAERIGDRNNAGPKRDRISLETIRIAFAVEALVMVPDGIACDLRQLDAGHHLERRVDVALHVLAGSGRQLETWAVQHIAERELTDVTQHCTQCDRAGRFRTDLQLTRHCHGQQPGKARIAAKEGIPVFDQADQHVGQSQRGGVDALPHRHLLFLEARLLERDLECLRLRREHRLRSRRPG
jgi:hypothetical protein